MLTNRYATLQQIHSGFYRLEGCTWSNKNNRTVPTIPVIILPAQRLSGLGSFFEDNIPILRIHPSGMDLSVPPTPLQGALPLGGPSGNRTISRPKYIPKPLRNDLLTSTATFLPSKPCRDQNLQFLFPPDPQNQAFSLRWS